MRPSPTESSGDAVGGLGGTSKKPVGQQRSSPGPFCEDQTTPHKQLAFNGGDLIEACITHPSNAGASNGPITHYSLRAVRSSSALIKPT